MIRTQYPKKARKILPHLMKEVVLNDQNLRKKIKVKRTRRTKPRKKKKKGKGSDEDAEGGELES